MFFRPAWAISSNKYLYFTPNLRFLPEPSYWTQTFLKTAGPSVPIFLQPFQNLEDFDTIRDGTERVFSYWTYLLFINTSNLREGLKIKERNFPSCLDPSQPKRATEEKKQIDRKRVQFCPNTSIQYNNFKIYWPNNKPTFYKCQ